ncbi:hypothetical protein QF026_001565 [Streptomyces aurantiacus]|nr:hypothetical protein [Streptomyces aurantiacus]
MRVTSYGVILAVPGTETTPFTRPTRHCRRR